MDDRTDRLYSEFAASLEAASSGAEVAALKAEYLGKKGRLNDILKSLKDASPEERKSLGARSNELKQRMLEELDAAVVRIEREEIDRRLASERQDISLIDSIRDRGLGSAGYHPLTIIGREVEDIFISMGFDILDGPHIESDYYNFEALNIPENHPARDMQDTFWFSDMHHLLRTPHISHSGAGHGEAQAPL